MALSPGSRLGPYEIIASIGAGGMGEVCRARDTKLNRDVAIKTLPDSFALDADRVARFTREAQVLASLNHPNIAAIYGIEEQGGTRALVMELVEGEDLSAHIARGAMPLAEVLPIARQIADALEAAHELGIVHRDLKPANIKIRADGAVKVLDFGLAKAMDPSSGSGVDAMNSPTLTARATQMGMIIGTAAYMAPEQARGRAVDRRADVWAFGVVLYEMLAGTRAFDGEDISITLAGVLKEDVKWDALPTDLPPSIRRLLRRCLEKDPKRRLRAIGDARLELDEASAPTEVTRTDGPPSRLARWERWIWASVAVAAAIAAVIMALRPVAGRDDAPVTARFGIAPPAAGAFSTDPPRIAISPDGKLLVFGAVAQTGKPDQLWLRRLDSMELTPIPGTESGGDAIAPQSPFWSPDAKRLAYFVQSITRARGSRLRVMDVQAGTVQMTCDFPSNNAGGSWNASGDILVSTQATKGVQRISAGGCAATPVTTLDASKKEVAHLFPEFLPDGRHFIYQAQTSGRENWTINVGSVDSADRRQVVRSDYARFAAPNVLLYAQSGNLLAQVMDLATYELTGEPVVLATGLPAVPTNGRTGFDASNTGVLVFSSNPSLQRAGDDRQLTWLDRSGKPLSVAGPRTSAPSLRLSPDATRVALLEDMPGRALVGNRSLWVADLTRDVKAPLATERPINGSTWSADSLRLRFAVRDDNGESTVFERAASGATPAAPVFVEKGYAVYPLDELRDGTLLLAASPGGGGAPKGLYVLSKPGARPSAYLDDGFNHPQASFSPDGRWLAYVSTESTTSEIIVQPFPDASSGKWRISTNGGVAPRWRRDGRELFYVDAENRLIAVPVTTDHGFSPGKATPLFFLPSQGNLVSSAYIWDAAPDGQRFLVSLPAGGLATDSARVIPLTVVTNWTPILKRK